MPPPSANLGEVLKSAGQPRHSLTQVRKWRAGTPAPRILSPGENNQRLHPHLRGVVLEEIDQEPRRASSPMKKMGEEQRGPLVDKKKERAGSIAAARAPVGPVPSEKMGEEQTGPLVDNKNKRGRDPLRRRDLCARRPVRARYRGIKERAAGTDALSGPARSQSKSAKNLTINWTLDFV
jgi:hypothetical protein